MTKYNWIPKSLEFCQTYGIDPEMVEAVVERPTLQGIAPESGQHGYPIQTYRRGDMEVCVSFKPNKQPAIAWVRLHLPIDSSKGSSTGGGPVRKAAAKAPNGLKQFKQWVHAAGYRPVLRNGHTHVLRKDGSLLMVTSSTPGDKMAITNAWQKFLRESAKDATVNALETLRKDLATDGGTTPSAPEEPSTVPGDGKWMCPHCNDWFGPEDAEDGDVPPVCGMCRKAGRT